MAKGNIDAEFIYLPSDSIEDLDSQIREHAIRTLGEAASYYGSTTGYSVIPVSMSTDAKKALISRVSAPMMNLRKELGFDQE